MRGLVIVLLVLLTACSEPDPRYQIPTQLWDGVVVEIQVRPTPIRPGMNEVMVLTTLERGKPVSNLLVSLRAEKDGEWQQAIQDGHSGVHRRALRLPGTPTLYVRLRKKRTEEVTVLAFPLVYEGS